MHFSRSCIQLVDTSRKEVFYLEAHPEQAVAQPYLTQSVRIKGYGLVSREASVRCALFRGHQVWRQTHRCLSLLDMACDARIDCVSNVHELRYPAFALSL